MNIHGIILLRKLNLLRAKLSEQNWSCKKETLSKEGVTGSSMFISQKAKGVSVCAGRRLSFCDLQNNSEGLVQGLLVESKPRINKCRLFAASRLRIHEFFRNIESFDPIMVSLRLQSSPKQDLGLNSPLTTFRPVFPQQDTLYLRSHSSPCNMPLILRL